MVDCCAAVYYILCKRKQKLLVKRNFMNKSEKLSLASTICSFISCGAVTLVILYCIYRLYKIREEPNAIRDVQLNLFIGILLVASLSAVVDIRSSAETWNSITDLPQKDPLLCKLV